MLRSLFLPLILLVCAGRLQGGPAAILSPLPGEVLQGAVSIRGSSQAPGFVSAEVAFGYMNDPTGTWFLLAELDQPVVEGVLASWDTTRITDGNYALRLRIYTTGGLPLDILISDLRVRNYSAVETPVHADLATTTTSPPLSQATPTWLPTPTPLPPNPAEVRSEDLVWSAVLGGFSVLVVLGLLYGYLWLRWKRT